MSRRRAFTAEVVTSTGGIAPVLGRSGIVWYSCHVRVGSKRVPHGFLLAKQPVGGELGLVLYDINSETISADEGPVDFTEEFLAWEKACDVVGTDRIIPFSDLNPRVHKSCCRTASQQYRALTGQSDGGCAQYVALILSIMSAQGLNVDPTGYDV